MEGKTVILSVFILSLVTAQTQVEAKSCCPSSDARSIYNICRFAGNFQQFCAQLSGCQIVAGSSCPAGYNNDILENPGDAINEYCKLGCTSSVCGALRTLHNSDASETVNGAVKQCTKACSIFCTKGSVNTVKTA